MHTVAVILARCVLLALSVLELAMLLRAILSFFIMDEDSRIMLFLAVLTEPIVAPVRALLSRFRFVAESPIDISFFVTMLLLSFITSALPAVI